MIDDAQRALTKRIEAPTDSPSGVKLFVQALLEEERASATADPADADSPFAQAAETFAKVAEMESAAPRVREYARASSFLLSTPAKLDDLATMPLAWADGDTLFRMGEAFGDAGEFDCAEVAYPLAGRVHSFLLPYSVFRQMTLARDLARWEEAMERAHDIGEESGPPWEDFDDTAKAIFAEAVGHVSGPVPAAGSSSSDRVGWLVHRCGPPESRGAGFMVSLTVSVGKDGRAAASAAHFTDRDPRKGLAGSVVRCMTAMAPIAFAGAKKSARFEVAWE